MVYGELRTADAYSHLTLGSMPASLIGFALAYLFLFSVFVLYVARTLRRGPERDGELGTFPGGDMTVAGDDIHDADEQDADDIDEHDDPGR